MQENLESTLPDFVERLFVFLKVFLLKISYNLKQKNPETATVLAHIFVLISV